MIQKWFGVKRVPPLSKHTDKPVDAEVTTIKWKEATKKLYGYASPKCIGSIEDIRYEMLIDSGAELCLMLKEVFDEVGLPIDYDIDWTIGSANSQKNRVYGICHEVPVVVGGIIAKCRFFVMENLSQDVILGRPWERLVRAKQDNRDDGSCYTTISDGEGNTATFCSVPTNHERNRSRARLPYMEKGRRQRDYECDLGKGVSQ